MEHLIEAANIAIQHQEQPAADPPSLPLLSDYTQQPLPEDGSDPQWHHCQFEICKFRISWFPGFRTRQEFDAHRSLHRCQWTMLCNLTPPFTVRQCPYLPLNEEDLVRHLEEHIRQDPIPRIEGSDGKYRFFCPWQTCSSLSYARKGASNRAHILDHIRKHVHDYKTRFPDNLPVSKPPTAVPRANPIQQKQLHQSMAVHGSVTFPGKAEIDDRTGLPSPANQEAAAIARSPSAPSDAQMTQQQHHHHHQQTLRTPSNWSLNGQPPAPHLHHPQEAAFHKPASMNWQKLPALSNSMHPNGQRTSLTVDLSAMKPVMAGGKFPGGAADPQMTLPSPLDINPQKPGMPSSSSNGITLPSISALISHDEIHRRQIDPRAFHQRPPNGWPARPHSAQRPMMPTRPTMPIFPQRRQSSGNDRFIDRSMAAPTGEVQNGSMMPGNAQTARFRPYPMKPVKTNSNVPPMPQRD